MFCFQVSIILGCGSDLVAGSQCKYREIIVVIINSVSPLSCQQKNSQVERKFQLKMQSYAYLCTLMHTPEKQMMFKMYFRARDTFHYPYSSPIYPHLELASLIQSLPV